MTVKEAAEKWGLSVRRVQLLCVEGRMGGVMLFGQYKSSWVLCLWQYSLQLFLKRYLNNKRTIDMFPHTAKVLKNG